MWELDHREDWELKNWCFELWCWRRLLRVPWTARRSNQPILKEINHEYSLEGLVLKLQYFGTKWEEPTHWKRPWCWERLRARREWDDRGWDGCMVSLIQWIWVSANSGRWWRTGKPGVLQLMGLQRVRHCLFRLFSNWTITVSLPLSAYSGWISLQSKGLSRVFSNTTVQNINYSALSFFYTPTLTSTHDYWKNHSLD